MYSTRNVVKVVRENINEYSLETNPIYKLFSNKLIDLHFLSENNMYITDNNPESNHESYVLKNVIFEGIDDPEYFAGSKFVALKAKFGDKIKNSRSYY